MKNQLEEKKDKHKNTSENTNKSIFFLISSPDSSPIALINKFNKSQSIGVNSSTLWANVITYLGNNST